MFSKEIKSSHSAATAAAAAAAAHSFRQIQREFLDDIGLSELRTAGPSAKQEADFSFCPANPRSKKGDEERSYSLTL